MAERMTNFAFEETKIPKTTYNAYRMLAEIQKRRCLCCGKEFTYNLGGFILLSPKCPYCGANVSIKSKIIMGQ